MLELWSATDSKNREIFQAFTAPSTAFIIEQLSSSTPSNRMSAGDAQGMKHERSGEAPPTFSFDLTAIPSTINRGVIPFPAGQPTTSFYSPAATLSSHHAQAKTQSEFAPPRMTRNRSTTTKSYHVTETLCYIAPIGTSNTYHVHATAPRNSGVRIISDPVPLSFLSNTTPMPRMENGVRDRCQTVFDDSGSESGNSV